MLQKKLNYLFIRSIENVTTKSLSFEKTIKVYVAKKNVG